MAKSNHVQVGEAFELLNNGLQPFVEWELKAVYKTKWREMVRQSIPEDRAAVKKAKKGAVNWDTQNLLTVMWDQ